MSLQDHTRSVASHVKGSIHSNAKILPCWCFLSCVTSWALGQTRSLARKRSKEPTSLCPAETWKGVAGSCQSTAHQGGHPHLISLPHSQSLKCASLPPPQEMPGSGSCCVVLGCAGETDGFLHSSSHILSLPPLNHSTQGPMLELLLLCWGEQPGGRKPASQYPRTGRGLSFRLP